MNKLLLGFILNLIYINYFLLIYSLIAYFYYWWFVLPYFEVPHFTYLQTMVYFSLAYLVFGDLNKFFPEYIKDNFIYEIIKPLVLLLIGVIIKFSI
jgi:hypothetical protein